jgi:4-hydroxy-tetrahydrodipicolinate synthase
MTTTENRPWRGVLVATALPLRDDLSVDLDAYAEHCAWLVENGCDGVVPNGSLGEYQVLTPEERIKVVETAVATIGGARVMPGVAAYGSAESRRWAEQARDAGCASVMLLPPNAYRADERSVLAHYAEVAKAGLPVVAYNNPIDTKVDLVPELLAKLHGEGYIRAVKEFSGDVRRACRSWRTTTRSTPRSTSSPNCSPSCTARGTSGQSRSSPAMPGGPTSWPNWPRNWTC